MSKTRGFIVGLTLVLGVSVLTPPGAEATAASSSAAPRAGGQTSGDSLFPDQGNTGYDVEHYKIVIDASVPPSITAVTTVTATTRLRLSSFSLDLEGLTVTAVRVDGRAATFSRRAAKLMVTPTRPVHGRFKTVISYLGRPLVHSDPDDSSEGWLPMPDGSTALNEPVGAMTWFPVNSTLRDKARYTYVITAPASRTVAANGELVRRVRHGAVRTWTWNLRQPIAPYLSLISIGDYRTYTSSYRSRSGRRITILTFAQPSQGDVAAARRQLPEILRFAEDRFGPYPFSTAGFLVHHLEVGYALETATRPFFPSADELGKSLVHEQSHQWFGGKVTPCDWGDIWLNEGFASYTQWWWDGAHGGATPAQSFAQLLVDHPAGDDFWSQAPADFDDPAQLFGDPVYDRGAMTLQALRQRVGDRAFGQILRRWTAQSQQRCATTAEFVALSERVSRQRLQSLFHDWLFAGARPAGY